MMQHNPVAPGVGSVGHGDHGEHADHGDSTVFGFWVYLMTDCILFGSLFAVFAVMRTSFAGGPTGKEILDIPGVAIETMLLLLSSITYGFAMLAAHRQEIQRMLGWLAVTFLLGAGFLGMEIHEFAGLIAEGNGPDRSAFLSSFFTLVATHGLHVTVGLIWMAVLMVQTLGKRSLSAKAMTRLTCLSLFWHFLDIVWICVFSFVYLMSVV
jgi:cytochrome o ubiquinol oxidase subunit 3